MSPRAPLFSGQGGGHFTWELIGLVDYSAQLASVTGLDFSTDFSGGIKCPQVQFILAGGGLTGGDTIGDTLSLRLIEDSTGTSTPMGTWEIKAIETVGKQTTITATHFAASRVPEGDYNYFTALASEPRAYAYAWLKAAANITTPLFTEPAYSDPYDERKASRVAAPASTLAGLAGFANATSRTGIRKGDERSSGQWGTSWTYFDDIPLTIDVQWDVAPGYAGQPSFVSNMPLYWHQAGQYWHITWTGRSKWPSLSSDKSQFPLGHTQYLALEVKCQGGNIFNPTTFLKPQDYNNPDTTQDIEITFKSRKEAKEFYRSNAAWLPPADYGWGWATYDANAQSDIKRWGGSKTVTITNIATYEGALAPYYAYSKSVVAPDAPTINCGVSESVEFGERVMQGANLASTTRLQSMLAAASFQYVPQRMDAAWMSLGITSNATLCPGYEIIQDVYPITINQLYTTRDFFGQACVLGSLGFYATGGTPWLKGVDTCPEAGTVFALALNRHTVTSISADTSYPMAKAYQITFKDPHNGDHTYTLTNPHGEGDVASIGIMQGQFSAGQAAYASGTVQYMAIGGELWQDNPGSLADRWTGSAYDASNGVTFPTSQNVSHRATTSGLYWLSQDGQLWERRAARPSSYSAGTKYVVRDQLGQEHKLFASNGYMRFYSASAMPAPGQYTEPLIDAYPLMSFLLAHNRVFGDNYNRQSYKIATTMAFASVEPGDVVAIQLEQLNNGAPTLGLVIGKSLSPTTAPTLEIVPMHKITADDTVAWTNLAAVLGG